MGEGAGDHMLDGIIKEAITATAQPSQAEVCKAHESIRQGIYALLLCEQDRRTEKKSAEDAATGNFIDISKGHIKAAGMPAMFVAVLVAMVCFQIYQSHKAELTTKETVAAILKEAGLQQVQTNKTKP
jgi:hypothetical protein